MHENIIWQDFEFFLKRLKFFPVSKTLELNENSFCVSTRTDTENWIYYPEKIMNQEIVDKAVKFFVDKNESFMWPVFDGGNEILEKSGLLYAGDLTAMCLKPENIFHDVNESVTIDKITSIQESHEFAKTSWLAFGGDNNVSKNYYDLIEAFMNDKNNFSLFLAKIDNKNAGTFIITHENNLMGVYYFAVVPEFRRKKTAVTMMNEICRLSENKTITLQATPIGRKFYEAFGFSELFKIPVYSTESDIF